MAFFDAFLELPGCWPQKNSPPLLTDLSLIGGTLRYGDDDPIWLPRALTALVLSGAHMDSMPFLLISPPKLRRCRGGCGMPLPADASKQRYRAPAVLWLTRRPSPLAAA